jgi:uncharacterized damage-inducible protein DinB
MPLADNPAAIALKLTAERAKLLDSFAGLPMDVILRPFEGGWSIKDVLAHVAMGEEVNVAFAKLMVSRDSPVQVHELTRVYPDFPGEFDLDKFNAWMTERWRVRPFDQVLLALDQARASTLRWLETLTAEQFERSGDHAMWGRQTVRGMFRILVIHDRFHRGDIEKRRPKER